MAESIEDPSSSPDDTLMEDEDLNRLTTAIDQFTPVIPPTVTEYYMKQSGLQTNDERVVKLVSATVQKFMTDIINDCFQLHKLRERSTHRPGQTNTTTGATTTATTTVTTTAAASGTATTDATGANADPNAAGKKAASATNHTLTLNELTHVLGEYGINVKKTHYYT